MTVEERREIFSKEVLKISDFEKLYEVDYNTASGIIRDIKRKLTIGKGQELRLSISGKIHIQDYLDFVGVTADRYSVNMKLEDEDGKQQETCAS